MPMYSHHSAQVWVVKSLKQLDASALATATAAHKSKSLTRLHAYSKAVQNLDIWPARIGKLTVHKLNISSEISLNSEK